MRPPQLTEVKAERCRRSLAQFVRHGWETLEPETPLLWNWHIDAICEHLEAVSRGDITRLVINIPPGHMKSLLVAVFWPAWEWIDDPAQRTLFGSYAYELALRDSVKTRDLIKSQWYTDWFAPDWRMKEDQDNKGFFQNTKSGFRFSLSVGGVGTGFRGHKWVADDPLNAKDAHSVAARAEAIKWVDKTMSSRLNDPRTGKRVMVCQRLHEEDPAGHCRAKGWDALILPSEFVPEKRRVTGIGWTDPRTERGELLFAELFTPGVLAEAKTDLGSDGFAAQHQQEPAPAEGAILQKIWWRYWVPEGMSLPPVRVELEDGQFAQIEARELPPEFDEAIQSWDMTFKDTKAADLVCGQVWKRLGADKFLVHQVNEKMSFTKTCKAVRDMSAAYPEASAKLVEDKANGPAVIDALKSEVSGLIAIEPEGGKIARCHAIAPQVEAGNVYLPHPLLYAWVEGLLHDATTFPFATNDDTVDALTQALNRWTVKKKRKWGEW